MPVWLPIDPGLDENKCLRVLVPLFGREESKPYPESAPTFESSTGIEIGASYYESALQAAASLGMGELFQMEAEGFVKAITMDFRVGIPRYRTGAPGTTKIIGTFWGFTIRIAMRARMFSASAKMDLSYLAASVEAGAAEIQYSVSAIGIDRTTFAAALRGVPLFGEFDYSTFARLNAALEDLKESLAARLSTHPLLPISVWVENPFGDPISEARSVRWAINKIFRGIKLDAALAEAPRWANQRIVRKVYQEFLDSNINTDIPQHVADRARDWLALGLKSRDWLALGLK
jgi:hypothetical protein